MTYAFDPYAFDAYGGNGQSTVTPESASLTMSDRA